MHSEKKKKVIEIGLSEYLRVKTRLFHRAMNAVVKRVGQKPDSPASIILSTTNWLDDLG